jgi:HTH-type transcriptional regulator / antitoxin HigA
MSMVQAESKGYMALIRRFPLMFIRDKSQWQDASHIVEELSSRISTLSKSERAYYDVLCDLVKHYENEDLLGNHIVPQQALRYLMDINGLTADDIMPIVKDKTRLSDFLNDSADLSETDATRLAERFKVSPKMFLAHHSH